MKKLFLFFLFTLMLTPMLSAQQSYQEWLAQEEKDFQQYLDQQEKAFLSFLKDQKWEKFDSDREVYIEKKPKPDKPPKIQLVLPTKPEVDEKVPQRQLPDVSPPPKLQPTINTVPVTTILFYNRDIKINYPTALSTSKFQYTYINKQTITRAFEYFARFDWTPPLEQLSRLRQQLQLNDWGLFKLVDAYSYSLYPEEQRLQNCLSWYLLLKMRYDARIGYSANDIHLMVPCQQKIYEKLYWEIEKQRYYVLSARNSDSGKLSLRTYTKVFSGANTAFDLNVEASPILGNNDHKTRQFRYQGDILEVPVSPSLMHYWADYPLTDVGIYFNAELYSSTERAVLKWLKEKIAHQSEYNAVQYLLHFTQHAFQYQTDTQQFGRSKPFFVPEIFYYPYSDCEDRAILFAWLVRQLVDRPVVGVGYPGHVATAVQFSSTFPGDRIKYKNSNYTICDPTYINANIGQSMPMYRKTQVTIVPIH